MKENPWIEPFINAPCRYVRTSTKNLRDLLVRSTTLDTQRSTQRLPYPDATSVSCGAPVRELAVFHFCFFFLSLCNVDVRRYAKTRFGDIVRDIGAIGSASLRTMRKRRGYYRDRKREKERVAARRSRKLSRINLSLQPFFDPFLDGKQGGRGERKKFAKRGKKLSHLSFPRCESACAFASLATRDYKEYEWKRLTESYWATLCAIVRTMHIRVSLNNR